MVTEVTSKYNKEEYMYTPPGESNAACPGCGAILALRLILKAIGEKAIFVMMAGCATGFHKFRPLGLSYKGVSIPKAGAPFGQAGIHAGGIKSALTFRGDTETQVVVFAGDGATFDLGLAGVSAAAERNEDIIYVCYDNEQYMNTGRHRSSATPWQAATTTSPLPTPKQEQKKDIMSIIAASHVPYAATATVAFPDDLIRKAQKAKGIKGFRFLHVLTPCPVGWQYPSKSGIELSRLAVETKIFPLFEVEHGFDYTINIEPKGLPVEEYVTQQTRTRHLTPHQREEFQGIVEQRWERLQLLAGVGKERAR